MFIATANYAGQIPKPLYDRMEVISIPGYIPDEKLKIASRYLVPRQITAHGLKRSQLRIGEKTLRAIVQGYTRESGVRELERRVGAICRKVAASIAKGELEANAKVKVAPENLEEYLGRRKFHKELEARVNRPGVVVGLAWTPFGGDVLFVEAASMPGRGRVQVTGHLGEVMSESARIAVSVVRDRADRWGVDTSLFAKRDIHIHVPEGAVPKDGPSAGVTLATTLVSLLTNNGSGLQVLAHVAMTGELTLRGAILPVGGIREKVVAAKRAGIKTVIVPARNEPDTHELPDRVKKGLNFVFAEDIEDVLRAALPSRFGRTLDTEDQK
jgi:ATP-dependent Lon protease